MRDMIQKFSHFILIFSRCWSNCTNLKVYKRSYHLKILLFLILKTYHDFLVKFGVCFCVKVSFSLSYVFFGYVKKKKLLH